jgi:hypothetical protein
MSNSPIKRQKQGVLWKGRQVTLDDFGEVREYVDACLAPSKAPPEWADRLSQDFSLLKLLVKEIDKAMPDLNSTEWADALARLPDSPARPQLPYNFGRFSDPIFHKTLDHYRAHKRFLVEYRKYEAQRKEWEALNSEHRRLSQASGGSKSKVRDLPGKPTPPPAVSKFGNLPDNLKGAFHNFLRARDELAVKLLEWRKAIKEHSAQLPELKRRLAIYQQFRASFEYHSPKRRFIERMLKDLDRAISDGGLVFESLRWKVLPPGEVQTDTINRHFQSAKKRFPKKPFDDTRLKKVITLKPSKAYVGTDEFDGYIVFLFPGCHFAVLECPWFGNALYMLCGDWNALSKLSKSDLLGRHSTHARRIIHDENGNWFKRLKLEIKA